jgi:Nucleoside 2-deoxyribosyltransferase like
VTARVLRPPAPLDLAGRRAVFLAGSIEMGLAGDWQAEVIAALADLDVAILNPRREDWDSSWRQSIDDPRFREQVEWEIAAQERADLIPMYFAPETRAPITLLELGLFAASGKQVVCCPEGYWRKGNVEVVCARYRIPFVETLPELIGVVRSRLG